MRGTVLLDGYKAIEGRITPAHAGNRLAQILRRYKIGSPPRMRGTVDAELIKSGLTRITPAHAGNSGIKILILIRWWDHPRACGEQ